MHPHSADRLLQTTLGHRAAQALRGAIEIGLFTELARGPRTARQLRRALGLTRAVAERGTPDLLDALVALGLLDREGDDADAVYLNTREADHYLDRCSPAYLGDALVASARRDDARWHDLAATLRGPVAPPREIAHAQTHAHAQADAHALRFAHGVEAALQRIDFAHRRAIGVDDGGSERIARALRERHPRVRCTPLSPDAAWPTLDALVLVGRLSATARPAQPTWVRRAHAALRARGTLIVIDTLIDDTRRHNLYALLASLSAALEPEAGAGCTAADVDAWCREAGFRATEFIPLGQTCSAIVAQR